MNNNNLTIEQLIRANNHNYDANFDDFLMVLSRTRVKINAKQESPYVKYLSLHRMWVKGIASAAVFGALAFALTLPQTTIAPNGDVLYQISGVEIAKMEEDLFITDLDNFADDISFVDDHISSDDLIDSQNLKGTYFYTLSSFA